MKSKGVTEGITGKFNAFIENSNMISAGALGAMLLLNPVPTLIGAGAAYFLNNNSGHILPKATAAAGVCVFIANSVPIIMTLCTVALTGFVGKSLYDKTKPVITNLANKVQSATENVREALSNLGVTDSKTISSTVPSGHVYFIG